MSYEYDYPRPALTVDCIIFGYDHEDESLHVLLIERGEDPFKGQWALPGGFVGIEESAKKAAERELKEETDVEDIFLEQLYTFTDPERDPRGRVVSIGYYALVNLKDQSIEASSDADDVKWFETNSLPTLAFDHKYIFDVALQRLQNKISYAPIGFELLPKKFPIRYLQSLYETVLDRDLDRRNFRRRMMKLGIIEETGEKEKDVSHRPALLYRVNQEVYESLMEKGYPFEF